MRGSPDGVTIGPDEKTDSRHSARSCQRALDRLDCAKAILEAATRSRLGSDVGKLWEQVSEAVRVLAGNWSQDYPEGQSSGCW